MYADVCMYILKLASHSLNSQATDVRKMLRFFLIWYCISYTLGTRAVPENIGPGYQYTPRDILRKFFIRCGCKRACGVINGPVKGTKHFNAPYCNIVGSYWGSQKINEYNIFIATGIIEISQYVIGEYWSRSFSLFVSRRKKLNIWRSQWG